MEKRDKIMQLYALKNQIIDLKKQHLIEERDKKIEENFENLLIGTPKVKSLKRKVYTKCQKNA
ncbi:MAG: hypothetical protein E7157_00995 [Lactobacillales bacterium]|nr:hypothetical protein [Lactobacillales bacterium]